jgi:hypothetical protein
MAAIPASVSIALTRASAPTAAGRRGRIPRRRRPRLVQESRERLPVGDVERIAGELAELGQIRDGRLLERHVTITDDHPGAAGQQRLRGGKADAAGGAGDRDGLAPDVVHAAELYTCQVLLEVPLSGNTGGMTTDGEPGLESVMTYVVRTSHPVDPTAGSPWGSRQYWQVSEATLDGPGIKARLAATGVDWMGVSGDGFWRPDVRAQFLTDDGAVVLMHYTGLVEQTARFAEAAEANEATDWADQYMRLSIRFETGAAPAMRG